VGAFMEKHPKKDIVIPVSSGDAIDDVDADLIAGAEEALES